MRRLAEPDVLAAVRRRVKPPRPPTGMALIYWVIGIGTAATVFLGGAATFTRRGALQVASLALGFGLHALLVLLRMRRRARTPVDLDPVEALSPEALLEKLGLRVG
jgi:hypothetical protein